MSKIFK